MTYTQDTLERELPNNGLGIGCDDRAGMAMFWHLCKLAGYDTMAIALALQELEENETKN